MSKYEPLEIYLKSLDFESIPMTFTEIELVIEDGLPPSARKYRTWWSNNPSNSTMSRSLIAAGFKVTKVNMNQESLVFVKIGAEYKIAKAPSIPTLKKSDVHPAFGCLQGTVTIPCDTDLTAPVVDGWADIALNAKLYND